MATSNFLQFDSNQINMLSDEDYVTDTERLNGFAQGISRSILFNKAVFQSSTMSSALAQVLVSRGLNAIDNNVSTLASNISTAFPINRGLPVGMVMRWSGKTGSLPLTGFVAADGSAFDPAKYPELASAYRVVTDTYLYGQVQVGGVWWPKTPVIRSRDKIDYGSATRIPLNSSYTVSYPGVIIVNTSGNYNYCTNYIDENDLGFQGANFSNYTDSEISTFDVSPGQVYRSSGGGNVSIKFYPAYYNEIPSLIVAQSGVNLGQESGPQYSLVPVTLTTADWENNTQTITIAGITSQSEIDFGAPIPSTQANVLAISNSGIFISALGNGTVTFTCLQTPSVDLSLTIKLWR